jgi:hypothetical protein
MGKLYGGATGFTELCGIWRDDENGGQLLTDKPIMIQSLAKREDVGHINGTGPIESGPVAVMCPAPHCALAVELDAGWLRQTFADMGVRLRKAE